MKNLVVVFLIMFNSSTILNGQCSDNLEIKIFKNSSDPDVHMPSITVTVDDGYKIIGGGAELKGNNSLLTKSYPMSSTRWFAEGKDHKYASKTTITAYAIAIKDPNDCWDVIINQAISNEGQFPETYVDLDYGYIMTGGGAKVSYSGAGNLLTESRPEGSNRWVVKAKDHLDYSPKATATAYIIGIKPTPKNSVKIINKIVQNTGEYGHAIESSASLENGYQLTGGGAKTNCTSIGSLLTRSYPSGDERTWIGTGKDHGDPCMATLTTFAIGIKKIN